MLHRDEIIINKIISEINVGIQLLGEITQEELLKNEMLKRAIK